MINSFSSAAVFFALSIAMLSSCSSDLGGGNPISFDDGFQIYLNGSRYNGSGVIRVEVYNNESRKYDYMDIGEVRDGFGKLSFPASISDKYFHALRNEFPNSVTISPTNARGTSLVFFYVISRDDAYFLKAENNNETEFIEYRYIAQVTTVGGSETDFGINIQYKVNASEGWNAFYVSCTRNFSTCNASEKPSTVNLSGIKWLMEYEGNSLNFGGSDR